MSLTKVTYSMIEGAPINATDYGAIGDGVANDTTAIQNALNAAGAASKKLILNNGIYLVTSLTVPSNVTLIGESVNAVIKSIPTGLSFNFIIIDGASNVTIDGVSFNMDKNTGADGNGAVCITLNSTTTAIDNVTIQNCTFDNADIRPFIDVRTSIESKNLTIVNNRFFGQTALIPKPNPSAQNTQGIRLLCTAVFNTITIDNNYFKYIGFAMQMRPSPVNVFDRYFNVSWSGNVVTETVYDPNTNGITPIEIFGATNVVVDGNKIDSSGRGLCAVFVKNGVYNNNVVKDQLYYFMEVASCDGLTISNNTSLNCRTFVNVTSDIPTTSNVSIIGNVVKGGNQGVVEVTPTGPSSIITVVNSSIGGHNNWNISDNLFIDNIYTNQKAGVPGSGGTIIRVETTDTENWVIANNQFIANDELVTAQCINVIRGSNIKILNNNILRTADISDITYETAKDTVGFINVSPRLTNKDIIVSGNTVKFTGTDTRTGGFGAFGIGSFSGANALPGGQIIDNTIIGNYAFTMFLPYTSLDVVVKGNNVNQATGTLNVNAAIVYLDIRRQFRLAAAPTTGSWTRGDVVMNQNPTIGQPTGWMCTVTGTPGTWVAMANL
jgi:hypothetical protein